MREAGLIITSDLCPVTPGLYTRREASLVISSVSCLFDLTGWVMSFLDLNPANRALALRRGLGDSGVVSWFLRSLLIHPTIRVCRRSARAALWTHSTHHDAERHHGMIVLAPCAVYGRKVLTSRSPQEVADFGRAALHGYWEPRECYAAFFAVDVVALEVAVMIVGELSVTPGPTQQRASHP
jgi:hypothetical protein